MVLDPALPWWRGALYLLYLAGLIRLFQAPLLRVCKRTLLVLPFLLVVLVFAAWSAASPERLFLLVQKALLSAAALAVLGVGTDFPSLLKGLHRLGLPSMLVMMLSFMYRYLDLLLGEAKRMEIARNQRYFGGGYLRQLRVLGNMIGSLFLRTYERGERIYQAMILRGYSAEAKPETVTYGLVDKIAVFSALGVLVFVVGTEHLWRLWS